MKKNHLSLRRKASVLPVVAIGALLLSSCAKDGFDEESFDSGVYNTQLETPSADKIEITASVDGSQQTISWPVVYGAGGYHAVLTNVDAGEIVKDTVLDGCSFATARVADTNYEVSLAVLGNEDKNNAGGEVVIKTFNTFAVALATIPSGTDLNAYFQENGIGEAEGDAVYDLEPGGSYTLSGVLDLGAQSVLLRSMGSNATITCADGACFKLGNGFKLQNVNVDNTGIRARATVRLAGNFVPFIVFFVVALAYILLKDGYAVDPATGEIYIEADKYFDNFIEMWPLAVMLLAGVTLFLYGSAKTLFRRNYYKGIWPAGAGAVLAVLSLLLCAGWNDTAYYPSTADLQSSLTISNSSSSEFTLGAMSVVSILVPFVAAYIAYVWCLMDRKKITKDDINGDAY